MVLITLEYKTKSGRTKQKLVNVSSTNFYKRYGKLNKLSETGETVYGRRFKRETKSGKITNRPTTESKSNYIRDSRGVYVRYDPDKTIPIKTKRISSSGKKETVIIREKMSKLKSQAYRRKGNIYETTGREAIIKEKKVRTSAMEGVPQINRQMRGIITFEVQQETTTRGGTVIPEGERIQIETYSKVQGYFDGQPTNYTEEQMFEQAIRYALFRMYQLYGLDSGTSQAWIVDIDLDLVNRV